MAEQHTTFDAQVLIKHDRQSLGVLALILMELTRTCQHEIIKLGGVGHGVAFKAKLLDIIDKSKPVGDISDEKFAEARKSARELVDTLIQFHDPAGKRVA